MQVKYYLAEGDTANRTMMELLSLARGREGKTSLSGLTDNPNGILLNENNRALVLVGGRDSIFKSLLFSGGTPRILGVYPLLATFARKHRVFGKNETCLKLVCGTGHQQPVDGSEFIHVSGRGATGGFSLNPVELAHLLHILYGWG